MRIYADNAATTRLLPQALEAMLPFLREEYGNPSSLYSFGQSSRQAVEASRRDIAACLGCRADEVFFTSGGSEADNWAVKMAAMYWKAKGKNHIITTVFEHHAILHSFKALEKQGLEVTYLPVDQYGFVQVDDVRRAIRPQTALVSVMMANNEIGTIQPIAEIGAVCRELGVWFHTDAVQAVGHIPVNFSELPVDLLSLSGHKFHGPKGVGALLIRRGLRFPNLIDGGAQEVKRRAGTENTPGIVGMAAALKHACASMTTVSGAVAAMRDRLIKGLLDTVPHCCLNGDADKRLPGNVNISFEGIEGESLLLMLDMQGICASSGSACTSGSLEPSHVLLGIGLPHEIAHGSLRLTLSAENTEKDVDNMLRIIPEVVTKLRDMSPLWEKLVKENAHRIL